MDNLDILYLRPSLNKQGSDLARKGHGKELIIW